MTQAGVYSDTPVPVHLWDPPEQEEKLIGQSIINGSRRIVEATLHTSSYPLHELKKSTQRPWSTPESQPNSKENIRASIQSWEKVKTW